MEMAFEHGIETRDIPRIVQPDIDHMGQFAIRRIESGNDAS